MAMLQIELPDDVIAALSQDETALDRIALEALLVRLYTLGEIDSGRLAHLLNLSHPEALDLLRQYGVSPSDAPLNLEEAGRDATTTPYHPVQAGGIWAGVTITDEDIAEVRREMWEHLGEDMV